MRNLLEVKNLGISFFNGGEKRDVVKEISFDLKQGEVLGIVGESGSGKSVTALSLVGLLSKTAQYSSQSSIKFLGQEIVNADENDLRKIRGKDIAYIFQEPMSSLNPLHRIGDQIAESLILHRGMSRKQALKEAVRLLVMTGIRPAAEKSRAFPFELSGGQRQRVMIAMAIANHPRILVADEPTTALDVTVQEQIINLLIKLKNKLDMAIVFISHDLRLIRKIADYVCVMKDGKIVEQGMTQKVFEQPEQAYTKTLMKTALVVNEEQKCGDVILSGRNLTVKYPLKKNFWGKTEAETAALDRVNVDLFRGECLGVVGESGSGKTTLGMVMADLIKSQGEMRLENASYRELNGKFLHKKVQIVFQDPYNSLNPRMNVEQIIGEGVNIHFPKMNKEEKKALILKNLHNVGLDQGAMERYPHEFSGGQRQRIAIARALAVQPEVIILDEPTSALDVTIQLQIIELLKDLKKRLQLSYVFISHDMQIIRAMSDRVMVMNNGKCVESGLVSEIFEHPKALYTRKLIEAGLY